MLVANVMLVFNNKIMMLFTWKMILNNTNFTHLNRTTVNKFELHTSSQTAKMAHDDINTFIKLKPLYTYARACYID